MTAAGDTAIASLRAAQAGGSFILVVEGGIPTAFDGMTCTVMTENGVDISMKAAVEELAPMAQAVVCVGACACFGGIPGADPDPTRIRTVNQLTGVSTLNLPGCPAHPDWIAGTLAALLCGDTPPLDDYQRPTAFYGNLVHDNCPRKFAYDVGNFAVNFGEQGRCLVSMGCNGLTTHSDCPLRGWNNSTNYCVRSNGNCIGCTESDFPKDRLIYRD
jgi:NiFe hydrogenase small subunit HydA